MGSELVGDSPPQTENRSDNSIHGVAPFIKYTTIFEENFPLYLSIGMTYEQYWEQDCYLTKYYLKAYKLKEERNLKQKNYEMWLQGAYIYEALCDVAPILHAFAEKGTTSRKYLSKPFALTEEEREEQENIDRQERMEKFKSRFMNSVKKK